MYLYGKGVDKVFVALLNVEKKTVVLITHFQKLWNSDKTSGIYHINDM